jgi:hypothetical protein
MSGEINVISRTQQVIVEPASSAVSIINAGPQGPGGPAGSANWTTARTIETVSAGTYSVVAADAGKLKRLTVACTITLPSGGISVGQFVDFVCITGVSNFVLGSSATWDVPPTPTTVARAVGSFVTALKMSATAWALTGDLA